MTLAAAIAWLALTFLGGLLWSIADESEDHRWTKIISIIVALVAAFAFGYYAAQK